MVLSRAVTPEIMAIFDHGGAQRHGEGEQGEAGEEEHAEEVDVSVEGPLSPESVEAQSPIVVGDEDMFLVVDEAPPPVVVEVELPTGDVAVEESVVRVAALSLGSSVVSEEEGGNESEWTGNDDPGFVRRVPSGPLRPWGMAGGAPEEASAADTASSTDAEPISDLDTSIDADEVLVDEDDAAAAAAAAAAGEPDVAEDCDDFGDAMLDEFVQNVDRIAGGGNKEKDDAGPAAPASPAAAPSAPAPSAPAAAQPAVEAAAAVPADATGPGGAPLPAVAQSGFYPVVHANVVFDALPLQVVTRRGRTGFEESREFPIVVNEIIAGRYQILEYLGSAAFSRAVQCLDLATGSLVCIKIIKNSKDFFDQSLDEIKLLHHINSSGDADRFNVVQLFDYFYHREHLFLVFELLRDNLYEFSKYIREYGEEEYFTLPRLQRITRQILQGLDFIHASGVIHCDLKPENILIKSYSRCLVKIIDFGSSCFLGDRLSSYVQSRAYRAPEVILGMPYDGKIDVWSLGCILAELWTGRVLLQNDSVPCMLARMSAILSPPTRAMLRKGKYASRFFTSNGEVYEAAADGSVLVLEPKPTTLADRLGCEDERFVAFVRRLLAVDPNERPSAAEALSDPWFDVEYETAEAE